MTSRPEISENDLHAYIDGALEGDRLEEVEAAIGADTALAGRVASFRSDKDMTRRIYAPLVERPVPAEWIALARSKSAPAPAATNWRMVGSIAAVLLVAAVSAVGLWHARPVQSGEVVQAALDARERPVRFEKVVDVTPGASARQFDAVLKSTVAMNVKVPDLGRMGYHLIGLHLYGSGGAAELLYRDREGRLFTLYVRHSDGAARFDQFERRGLRVCVWQDDVLSTVMAGNVSTAAMQRLASLAYTGLTI